MDSWIPGSAFSLSRPLRMYPRVRKTTFGTNSTSSHAGCLARTNPLFSSLTRDQLSKTASQVLSSIPQTFLMSETLTGSTLSLPKRSCACRMKPSGVSEISCGKPRSSARRPRHQIQTTRVFMILLGTPFTFPRRLIWRSRRLTV